MAPLKYWWRHHKTKAFGVALMALGAIQANSGQLQQLISPKAYGWTILVIGVLVAILGFLNTLASKPDAPPDRTA